MENGVGYRPANPLVEGKNITTIYLDCKFNPIVNVVYKIGTAKSGQKVDYDRLELFVRTNGTIAPDDAVALAAKIMQNQLSVLVNFDSSEVGEGFERPRDYGGTVVKSPVNPNIFKKIDEMELSVRSYNCLRAEGIRYIGDLASRTEEDMLGLTNFGKKSLNELRDNLEHMGLHFGMKLDDWPPSNMTREVVTTTKKRRMK